MHSHNLTFVNSAKPHQIHANGINTKQVSLQANGAPLRSIHWQERFLCAWLWMVPPPPYPLRSCDSFLIFQMFLCPSHGYFFSYFFFKRFWISAFEKEKAKIRETTHASAQRGNSCSGIHVGQGTFPLSTSRSAMYNHCPWCVSNWPWLKSWWRKEENYYLCQKIETITCCASVVSIHLAPIPSSLERMWIFLLG